MSYILPQDVDSFKAERPRGRAVSVDTIDWPRCARCEMPVEFCWADEYDGGVMIIVRCHGQREVVDITAELWQDAIPASIDFGQAFGQEQNNA